MDAETLTDLFRRRAADPSTTLIDVPGGPTISYGDAAGVGGRMANMLRSVGVHPGDRVAVQVEKSPGAVLLYLACLRAGAVYLPINTAYSDAEIRYLLEDAEPAAAVCDPARVAAFTTPQVLTADRYGDGTLATGAAACSPVFDDVDVRPADMACILYTSGTTGRPKGAMLSHANLAANALALHQAWGFRPDDVLLHALPLYHAHGLFVAVNCVLANGTGMVFLPRFDADAVVEQLGRCTVFMGVPTYYTRLLADPRVDRDTCQGIRLFVSGSAPLLAGTHQEFRARTGHAILERYGMTETLMITSNPLEGERRPGSVGSALPGITVRIADPDSGAPCDRGQVGQIEVDGPSVFSGYWRRPELTASEFTTDGFFRTGDLGILDDEGRLTIVGRSKDLIISGGLNVYPKEVEDVLDELDGVFESAVVGLPDADLGERVVAAIVARPGRLLDVPAIRVAVRDRLAPFKVPKQVYVVDELPRNAMGKVEKATLRQSLGRL